MNDPINNPYRKKNLLAKCLLASLALHSTALYFFINHPIVIKGVDTSFFQKNSPLTKEIACEDLYDPADSTLDNFFEEFALNSLKTAQKPLKKDPLTYSEGPLEEQQKEIASSSTPTPLLEPGNQKTDLSNPLLFTFEPDEPISLSAVDVPLIKPSAEIARSTLRSPSELLPPEDFLVSAPLVDDRIHSDANLPINTQLPHQEDVTLLDSLADLPSCPSLDMTAPKENPQIAFSHEDLETPSLKNYSYHFSADTNLTPSYQKPSYVEIDDYLPNKTLYSLKWNEEFDVKPSFFPDKDGYIFSITITPARNLEAERIKQNTYFFIDTSSEIEKHKITVFKKSVFKALSSLQEGDFFNIFLLDKTTVKLSPDNLQVSLPNVRIAQEFLEKRQDKPFFASFDLLQGLTEILKHIPEDDEVHTVILLTNGKLTSNSSSTQKEINKLLEKNGGKISLFTVTAGKNNNIVNLDMLSSLWGGKLLYSDTNASLPRKLSSFVKGLHSPLIKEISFSLQTSDPRAKISILPTSTKTPNLYQQEPFVIMGRTNRLAPMALTLEGKNEEGWVLLQKDLDFEIAEEASNATKKEWDLRQASILYSKFLEDSKSIHLKEAREVLKTAHGRVLGE